MQRQFRSLTQWLRAQKFFLLFVLILVAGYTAAHIWKDLPLLHHNIYDQYSRQAELWWQGEYFFTEDISYLELATYDNKWFVSFPPLPSVFAWALHPWFEVETPNTLISHLATLSAAGALYAMLRQRVSDLTATAWVALAITGSNMLQLGFSGSVWFHAQTLAFLFSSIAVWQLSRRTWPGLLWGGVALAVAVGCRPLNAVYGLVFLVVLMAQRPYLWQNWKQAWWRWVGVLYIPLLIAALYAWYNWLRFDNPLEFGHNYLPEHLRSSVAQLSWRHIPNNIQNILRLPSWSAETRSIEFPQYSGFAFWLVNPIFLAITTRVFPVRGGTTHWPVAALTLALVSHTGLLLSHVTLGGFQFGTRYLVDLIPWVLLWIYWKQPRWRVEDGVLMILGVLVNVYGFIWLYKQFT